MRRFIFQRLLMAFPVVLGVMFFSFSMLYLTPGDPAVIIAGPDASPDTIEALREDLGLNRPVYVQFSDYLRKVLSGDLGKSIINREPVVGEIARAFGPTVQLLVAGMAWAVPTAILLGIASALRRGTLLDRAIMVCSLLGLSLPLFWVGLMLIWSLSFELLLFPVSGWGGPIWTLQGLHYTVLPAVTLGLTQMGSVARVTRTSVLEVLNQDYIRTARSKGLVERRVIFIHALRNAALPIVTLLGLQFGFLLGGAVVTETIFSWPGLGRVAVRAILNQDFPVVQGVVLTIALGYVAINLLVDLLYVVLDPRIRYT